jgi:hypothetical protein
MLHFRDHGSALPKNVRSSPPKLASPARSPAAPVNSGLKFAAMHAPANAGSIFGGSAPLPGPPRRYLD